MLAVKQDKEEKRGLKLLLYETLKLLLYEAPYVLFAWKRRGGGGCNHGGLATPTSCTLRRPCILTCNARSRLNLLIGVVVRVPLHSLSPVVRVV